MRGCATHAKVILFVFCMHVRMVYSRGGVYVDIQKCKIVLQTYSNWACICFASWCVAVHSYCKYKWLNRL